MQSKGDGYDARVSRSVRVLIAGFDFSVRSDAKPKYVRQLAAMVEKKMKEAGRSGKSMSTQTLVMMAAMSLADDLEQAQSEQKEFKREVEERTRRILDTLEREEQS